MQEILDKFTATLGTHEAFQAMKNVFSSLDRTQAERLLTNLATKGEEAFHLISSVAQDHKEFASFTMELLAKQEGHVASELIGRIGNWHKGPFAQEALSFLALRDDEEATKWIGNIGRYDKESTKRALSLMAVRDDAQVFTQVKDLASASLNWKSSYEYETERLYPAEEQIANIRAAIDILKKFETDEAANTLLGISRFNFDHLEINLHKEIFDALVEINTEFSSKAIAKMAENIDSLAPEALKILASHNDVDSIRAIGGLGRKNIACATQAIQILSSCRDKEASDQLWSLGNYWKELKPDIIRMLGYNIDDNVADAIIDLSRLKYETNDLTALALKKLAQYVQHGSDIYTALDAIAKKATQDPTSASLCIQLLSKNIRYRYYSQELLQNIAEETPELRNRIFNIFSKQKDCDDYIASVGMQSKTLAQKAFDILSKKKGHDAANYTADIAQHYDFLAAPAFESFALHKGSPAKCRIQRVAASLPMQQRIETIINLSDRFNKHSPQAGTFQNIVLKTAEAMLSLDSLSSIFKRGEAEKLKDLMHRATQVAPQLESALQIIGAFEEHQKFTQQIFPK